MSGIWEAMLGHAKDGCGIRHLKNGCLKQMLKDGCGSKYMSLAAAKCKVMTLGSKKHCLRVRCGMRHSACKVRMLNRNDFLIYAV